jgi:hypothetical protein
MPALGPELADGPNSATGAPFLVMIVTCPLAAAMRSWSNFRLASAISNFAALSDRGPDGL